MGKSRVGVDSGIVGAREGGWFGGDEFFERSRESKGIGPTEDLFRVMLFHNASQVSEGPFELQTRGNRRDVPVESEKAFSADDTLNSYRSLRLILDLTQRILRLVRTRQKNQGSVTDRNQGERTESHVIDHNRSEGAPLQAQRPEHAEERPPASAQLPKRPITFLLDRSDFCHAGLRDDQIHPTAVVATQQAGSSCRHGRRTRSHDSDERIDKRRFCRFRFSPQSRDRSRRS